MTSIPEHGTNTVNLVTLEDSAQEVMHVQNGKHVVMIADSGCKRSVAGPTWRDHMRRACEVKGLKPLERVVRESFRFGDGALVPCVTAYTYPAGVFGHTGMLDVAFVDRSCPGLLSRKAMKDLGIVLGF